MEKEKLKTAGIGFCKGFCKAAFVSYLFYRAGVLSLLAGFAFGAYSAVQEKKLRQKKLFQEMNVQFREGLQGIAAALGAGYAMENAIGEARKDLVLLYGEESLLVNEFSHMEEQMNLNQPVEKVFLEFAQKWKTEDIVYFVQVFQTAKRTGGDFISIIRLTAEKIGEKAEVKREIASMVAGKRMEGRIMNVIPLGMIIYFWISSPGFLDCMYQASGRIVMTVLLVLYAAAYAWSESISDIQV